MKIFGIYIDPGSLLILASFALYGTVTPVFWYTARPWMAVMYLGYTIGAVGSFMIAMGHR
jgi:hypothetical protein